MCLQTILTTVSSSLSPFRSSNWSLNLMWVSTETRPRLCQIYNLQALFSLNISYTWLSLLWTLYQHVGTESFSKGTTVPKYLTLDLLRGLWTRTVRLYNHQKRRKREGRRERSWHVAQVLARNSSPISKGLYQWSSTSFWTNILFYRDIKI